MEKEKLEDVKTSFEVKSGGLIYRGELPKSAFGQFDLYTAMLAYWETKKPQEWAVLRDFIVSNSEVVQESAGIKLDIAKDLNFAQLKTLTDLYMGMAASFFTSPQATTGKQK